MLYCFFGWESRERYTEIKEQGTTLIGASKTWKLKRAIKEVEGHKRETTTIVVNMNMKNGRNGKASHDCVAHKLISKGSFLVS